VAAKITADSKAVLRAKVLAARDALPAEIHCDLNKRISARVLELPVWRDANCVLLYLSFGKEFDTAQLVSAALARGKQLCLPRVNRDSNTLEIYRVSDPVQETAPGAFGIREPRVECGRADLDKIDFVLVPGIAFTPHGDRLGFGRGYYDRLICELSHRPLLVAAAFTLQIRAQIPIGDGDRRVDWIITEQTSYRAS
jgi:5-formyltetrahydrofolate cyclo-ligase